MDELCKFLINHMILDFDGEVDKEAISRFLLDDGSSLARSLRGKLLSDGIEDFLIVLSDVLRESIPKGITPEKVKDHISMYIES